MSLQRLSAYYLDCLAKDIDAGISCPVFGKHDRVDYGQISELPTDKNSISNPYTSVACQHVIQYVRQTHNNTTIELGYPLFLRKFSPARGGAIYLLEPIFLVPYDKESLQKDVPELQQEPPRFNFEAIKNLSGFTTNELVEEVLKLSEEIGLNKPLHELPSLAECATRLQSLRPNWTWNETMNPQTLNTQNVQGVLHHGIQNSAAIFLSEPSNFTLGLIKELNDLKNLSTPTVNDNILFGLISGALPVYTSKPVEILEPLPLNPEQRAAVNKAMQAPFTVITGPPGTGKSQVVSSIIVNALYHGQTVVFASKNNKAVDVVQERVNALTSRPFMVRLGASTELQSGLHSYLTNILAATTTPDDNVRFEQSKERFEQLRKKKRSIQAQIRSVVDARNMLDETERSTEEYRDLLTVSVFRGLRHRSIQSLQTVSENVKNARVVLSKSDKQKQHFFIRAVWFLVCMQRFENADNAISILENEFNEFAIHPPPESVNDASISKHYASLDTLEKHLDYATKAVEYFTAFHNLQKLPSLFQLTNSTVELESEITRTSKEVLDNWIKLIPGQLLNVDRKILGDFVTVLSLIVQANAESRKPDNAIWSKYYDLLQKVSKILSCWAVTLLSLRGRVPFQSAFFDLVIIDEASQCDIASSLPLLYRAKRAVVIGDNNQLTHISSIHKQHDMALLTKHNLEQDYLSWSYTGNSLFGLAQTSCNSSDIIALKDHHRSHADIINFSNQEFYDGTLRIATNYRTLTSIASEAALQWRDVSGFVESPPSGGSYNRTEAQAIIDELRRLVSTGFRGSIGIVTPFKAQKSHIEALLNQERALYERLLHHEFLVDTVHKFQGDERDIILFSPVLSTGMSEGSRYFLRNTGKLFNVAITRARSILIVVGDKTECSTCGIGYLEHFVSYYSKLRSAQPQNSSHSQFGVKYPSVSHTTMVSDWEKVLYEELYKHNIRTIPQYQVDQYTLDMALILHQSNRKLNIEVDGELYHRSWDGELSRRDQLRNRRLMESGWEVLRFWVYEIRDDLGGCVKRVNEWVELNE